MIIKNIYYEALFVGLYCMVLYLFMILIIILIQSNIKNFIIYFPENNASNFPKENIHDIFYLWNRIPNYDYNKNTHHIRRVAVNMGYFLFIFGFLKHFLGYLLGIQEYWCKIRVYNIALNHSKTLNNNKNHIWIWIILIVTSILEGFLFVGLGFIIYLLTKYKIENHLNIYDIKNYVIFFFLGWVIHFFAEWIGIHRFYIKYICTLF